MKRVMILAALVALAAPLAGCADDSLAGRDPLQPYPLTGMTKTFNLTITEDVPWEVGPGAIYSATTYNGQIPGPTIEVTAGDHVVINLTNSAKIPHSIHTHVSAFTDANDGAHHSLTMPGETRTYEWDALFPGTFPYHDHADEDESVALGLFGAVVVHAPDERPANEHLVVLADFDQGEYEQLPGVADPETGEFPEEGTYHGGHQYMHTVNGKGYEDAVPPFEAKVGELQRWRVVSIGREFHTWHIHGHRWLDASGQLTDNIMLGPGMATTFEYMEDNPGEWPVHCHVPDHLEGGMVGVYIVKP
jgi:FtsP/CotA-like multicopper oxidase with cupredoxin domain